MNGKRLPAERSRWNRRWILWRNSSLSGRSWRWTAGENCSIASRQRPDTRLCSLPIRSSPKSMKVRLLDLFIFLKFGCLFMRKRTSGEKQDSKTTKRQDIRNSIGQGRWNVLHVSFPMLFRRLVFSRLPKKLWLKKVSYVSFLVFIFLEESKFSKSLIFSLQFVVEVGRTTDCHVHELDPRCHHRRFWNQDSDDEMPRGMG